MGKRCLAVCCSFGILKHVAKPCDSTFSPPTWVLSIILVLAPFAEENTDLYNYMDAILPDRNGASHPSPTRDLITSFVCFVIRLVQ